MLSKGTCTRLSDTLSCQGDTSIFNFAKTNFTRILKFCSECGIHVISQQRSNILQGYKVFMVKINGEICSIVGIEHWAQGMSKVLTAILQSRWKTLSRWFRVILAILFHVCIILLLQDCSLFIPHFLVLLRDFLNMDQDLIVSINIVGW